MARGLQTLQVCGRPSDKILLLFVALADALVNTEEDDLLYKAQVTFSFLKRTYYAYFQVHTCRLFGVSTRTCFKHALMFKQRFTFLIPAVLQHLFSPSV